MKVINTWFIIQKGQRLGPFSITELKEMLLKGEIHKRTFVWRPTMTNWARLCKTELASLLNIAEEMQSKPAAVASAILETASTPSADQVSLENLQKIENLSDSGLSADDHLIKKEEITEKEKETAFENQPVANEEKIIANSKSAEDFFKTEDFGNNKLSRDYLPSKEIGERETQIKEFLPLSLFFRERKAKRKQFILVLLFSLLPHFLTIYLIIRLDSPWGGLTMFPAVFLACLLFPYLFKSKNVEDYLDSSEISFGLWYCLFFVPAIASPLFISTAIAESISGDYSIMKILAGISGFFIFFLSFLYAVILPLFWGQGIKDLIEDVWTSLSESIKNFFRKLKGIFTFFRISWLCFFLGLAFVMGEWLTFFFLSPFNPLGAILFWVFCGFLASSLIFLPVLAWKDFKRGTHEKEKIIRRLKRCGFASAFLLFVFFPPFFFSTLLSLPFALLCLSLLIFSFILPKKIDSFEKKKTKKISESLAKENIKINILGTGPLALAVNSILCEMKFPEINLFDKKPDNLRGIVILAADSNETRKKIFKSLKYNFSISLFIDGRILDKTLEIYSLRPARSEDIKWYETVLLQEKTERTVFSTNEAILYLGITGNLIASQIEKFIKKESYPRFIWFDLKTLAIMLKAD